jgi:hypothetical protein
MTSGERTVKLRVQVATDKLTVDETVEGSTAEAVVAAIQQRAADKANFLVGAVIRRMSPLEFAREVTKRYNDAMKDAAPIPASCDEFVQMAVAKGFATPIAE